MMFIKKVNIFLYKIRNMYIGNMRFFLCVYKIYYYEIILFFFKEEQNELYVFIDFVYLCFSRYYIVVILIIEFNNYYF